MKADYVEHWHEQHSPKPGASTLADSTTFYAPEGYSVNREHLWNFFQSVRTRQPSVEDATFGNNTSIACHMANYSYFKKTVAMWDSSAREIRG